MKTKQFITPLVVSLFSLTAAGVISFANKTVKETEAYSGHELPTTIDLNDTSDVNIRSYYSSLNGLSESERSGTNLLKKLKTILKNGQNYYNYDSGDNVWKMYEITDRDWQKSPASSTVYGTYNANTNTITDYVYGSNSNGKNNPYVHALYINRDVNNQTKAWGNHEQDQWGINREHVWPKSQGFNATGAGGARGDPMHLMAGNGYSNNLHSNYSFGIVDKNQSYTNAGTKYSNQSGNLLGTSKTIGSGTVFEPQDSDKGDIARVLFYMVARYNYLSGSDSDDINSNNPNLELVQQAIVQSSYTSTKTNTGKLGVLSDLLEWNRLDPPDEYEIHRNNLLYTNFTNNRNPFIDFPEWAEYIWGTSDAVKVAGGAADPTGAAYPAGDAINTFDGGSTPVGYVSLSDTSLNLEVGNSLTISATSSDSSTITWTSNNTAVVTVGQSTSASNEDVQITAVAKGSATITASATIDDEVVSATCTVTVTETSVDPGTDTVTASVSIQEYAVSHGWEDSKKYLVVNIDDVVTATATGGGNTGKYYKSGEDWRFYQTESASVRFATSEGYIIKSITPTYNISSTGVLLDPDGNKVPSGTKVDDINTNSVVFTVGNSETATNGQVRFKNIEVEYYASTSLQLSETAIDLTVGSSKKVTASASHFDGPVTYTWESANESIATVTPTGNPATISIVGVGETTVTCTATDGENTKQATVSVEGFNPISISLDMDSISEKVGAVVEVTASAENIHGTATFEWEIEDSDIAVFKGIDDNTAVIELIREGETSLQCVVTDDKDFDYISIPIYSLSDKIPVTGVSLNKTNATMTVDDQLQLVASVAPIDATNQKVWWDSSDWTTATVSDEGLVTALKAGTVTITAETDEGEFTAECVITVNNPTIESIDVTAPETTYHPGETISKSELSIKVTYSNETVEYPDDFDFEDYMFTYKDAASGGAVTEKTLWLSYEGFNQSFTVNVAREAYSPTIEVVDRVDRAFTGVPSTKYVDWDDKVGPSGANYFGTTAGGNNSIQMRTSDDKSGIIVSTNGAKLTKITVNWNSNTTSGRTLEFYGKNTAYANGTADLYDSGTRGDDLGTLVYDSGTEITLTSTYQYIGIKSYSGALYVDYFDFTYEIEQNSVKSLVNFIMFEDTEGQCTTKLAQAIEIFESLTKEERQDFMTSEGYTCRTACERFEAWARNQHKQIVISGDDYVISNARYVESYKISSSSHANWTVTFTLICIVSIGVVAVGYISFRRKRDR